MRTASAAKKALLVIINTKSFQPQPFPASSLSSLNSLKKRRRRGPSSKITTNFGLRPNQYAGAPALDMTRAGPAYLLQSAAACPALSTARSKWPPAFARSHWRRQDVAHADVKRDACAHVPNYVVRVAQRVTAQVVVLGL